jgi:hypothetical protein
MTTDLAFVSNSDITFIAFSQACDRVSDEMIIDIKPELALAPVTTLPADQQPALTYLASLSRSSQRT